MPVEPRAVAGRRRARPARDRRGAVRHQAHGRRVGRGHGRRLHRRPRPGHRRALPPRGRRPQWHEVPDDAARQRRVDRVVRDHESDHVGVHGRGVARPVQDAGGRASRRRSPQAASSQSTCWSAPNSSIGRRAPAGRRGQAAAHLGTQDARRGGGGHRGSLERRSGGPHGTPRRSPRRGTPSHASCRCRWTASAARFSAWYELFPRSCASEPGRHGTLQDCEARLPYVAAMGFDVLYLPPIHPIGRTHRKGPTTTPIARARRRRQPVGDRRRRGRAQVDPPATSARSTTSGAGRRARERSASRSRWTSRSSARPTIRMCSEHPRVVPPAARRHDPVRREPAEEVPGHLSRSTSRPTTGRRSGTSCKAIVLLLDRAGRARLPRRQSRTPSRSASGSGDRRGAAATSGCDLPGRGVHAAEGDVPAGQARVHAVVHLLRLAQHEARADRVLHRAHADAGARVLPAQPLAEHAGHPAPSLCSTADGRRS